MYKKLIFSIIISLVIGILIGIYCIPKQEIIFDTSEQIDSLKQINDSLNTRLDSIHKQLEVNSYIYEKACSIIINQSFAADKESLSNYLERFGNGSKSRTSKNN